MTPTTPNESIRFAARFVADLTARTAHAPQEAILFGSRARGDNAADSDYDILLVCEDLTPDYRRAAIALGSTYLREHLADLSVHLVQSDQVATGCAEPYVINALREGVPIMTQERPQDLVPLMLERARQDLARARRALAEDDWAFAAGRAYYATFHAMTAALASRGLTYSKHSGVSSFFSLEFIKPGIFPEGFGEMIKELRMDREVGEYSYRAEVTAPRARADVAAAEEIVGAVEGYLQPQG